MDWKRTPSTNLQQPGIIVDITRLLNLLETADTMHAPVMTPSDALGRPTSSRRRRGSK